ncbi:DUF3885 domain-containing protein [Hymenobacter chitinivorans]|uniref:Uncharacterized protein DUF3885 n=1 Tax=Hymenobacter chitinivorans DSM 11115 TaxID=1121954 RepID=A0A2M9BM86_9BACT|nr:DUF3885 domain-containing protein [Hymenobacter chitinivorans]PJJ59051.1 uncharacterized protein DUF3885 [Hymenobacter chitinivorans DSM 11115]
MPLLPSTVFTRHYFPGLRLSTGLFYQWPIGIRFDLQGEEPIYLEPGHPGYSPTERLAYNEPYFREVNHRASALFHAAVQPDDEIVLVYQKSMYGRHRIRSRGFLLHQLGISKAQAAFQKIGPPYLYGFHPARWVRMNFTAKAAAIPADAILAAIANQDFGDRSPVIRGDLFFLNLTRGLIFHMYDDRGLDIIAVDKATLQPLFKTYNSWILDYDRAQVEAAFAGS